MTRSLTQRPCGIGALDGGLNPSSDRVIVRKVRRRAEGARAPATDAKSLEIPPDAGPLLISCVASGGSTWLVRE
ncbi:MAG TPA: hypothetical protein VHX44_02245, partial [Planctomycetota bacterium]|nr:hypothetical protein [Planctomycetota bacterium]